MGLTREQVEMRKQGIGASESVILFPEIPNSYSTPYHLWMIKTGRLESNFEMNDFQWWGHELEPAIAKRYEYETGETLEYRPETFIHEKLPYMLCHPDRFVFGKRKLLEIKTAQYSPDEWGEPDTDHIPPAYVFQVQHQLAVTGYEEADLIVFFLNYRQSRIYHIKRDNELIAAIESKISKFWNNHVLADIPPELSSLSDCKLKFSKNNLSSYIDIDDKTLEFFSNLKELRQIIKGAEQMEQNALMKVLEFIGENSGLKQGDKVLATWTCDKNGKRTFRLKDK